MADWIKDIPLLAKSVKVQAVVPSCSTLVILSLPVAAWNLLPDHPACAFVGFTTSLNLLLPTYYDNVKNYQEADENDSGSDQFPLASSVTSYSAVANEEGQSALLNKPTDPTNHDQWLTPSLDERVYTPPLRATSARRVTWNIDKFRVRLGARNESIVDSLSEPEGDKPSTKPNILPVPQERLDRR